MKTKFIASILLAVLCLSGQATTLTSTRTIELKTKKSMPVTRSGITIPIRAFIDGTVVSVEFTQSVSYAVVSVVHKTTGEIVHSEVVVNSTNVSFDLSGEESGEYRLELTIGGQEFAGFFTL